MKKSMKYNSNTLKTSLKLLSVTVSSMMIANVSSYASDIELYQAASEGGATVMLLFDNSGSMDIRSVYDDYSVGTNPKLVSGTPYCVTHSSGGYVYGDTKATVDTITQKIYNDDGTATTDTVSYDLYSCTSNSKKYYDRISRVKMALIPLLADPKTKFGADTKFTTYSVGLSNFFYTDSTTGGGVITYPAKPLTLANRKEMLAIIKGFSAKTNTPSAHAYAEAGAYMLGTNTLAKQTLTKTVSRRVGYLTSPSYNRYTLYKCNSFETQPNSSNIIDCKNKDYSTVTGQVNVSGNYLDISNLGYPNAYNANDGYYYNDENYTYQQDSVYSGFKRTDANSGAFTTDSNGNRINYNSPVTPGAANQTQCGGNGIYFLTDGVPNGVQSTSAIDLMNKALDKVGPLASANTKLTVGTDAECDSTLATGEADSNTTSRSGWKCIGKFAKMLRNTNNPIGRDIITGTAGFGQVFKDLDGKSDCTSTSTDATNLCKLGRKGEGFGEGGFYYVETPDQLASSIKSFIAGVGSKEIPAVSTGSMSVPLDSLNTQQSRGYAYTPILDPKPGVTTLWDGNLKKYYIRNSTVTSDTAGAQKVFEDKSGKFSVTTNDLWNTINDTTRTDTQRPDKALPQVGGAYQQVFEKTNNDRNLWVNINGTLTNIKVDATSKNPSGFTALKPVLRTDLVKPATGTDTRTPVITNILNNILVFIGYPAQAATVTDMDDSTVLTGTQAKTPKNIGGVMHSIPQLVTYGVTLNSDGTFKPSTRKDSVLYGSMDGALHLIDDSTGKEQFTFIPKEILDLQSGALLKGGQTTDTKLPYGVDAPWNVYATYNVNNSTTGTGSTATTTTDYAANQIFASGGLRMGGSTYYNLNISNSSSPSMVYSVGSNYANVLQGKATTLYGMKNGTYGNATSNTDEQKAFARMGQTWGKPSVGFVKSNGKKIMVNFLPGGYDNCYEDATFTLKTSGDNSTCATKTQAQGNAVYMVRVGEEKTDSTTKKTTIDTSTDNGKLLWWASSGTAASNTSRVTSLQKSEHTDMTNSIVTEIRTVDRNYDGLTDHIYFADLGGRVWRADINNNKDTDTFRVDRVVKLLDVSAEKSGTDAPPRFYERPLLTVTDEISGEPMGQITVGTGNRSLPITEKRSTSDMIYSFIDRDVASKKLFCYKSDADCKAVTTTDPTKITLGTANLTKANLQQLTYTNGATSGDSFIKTNMKLPTTDVQFKHGWYYPLTQWNTINGTGASIAITSTVESNVQGLKMFNEPDAQSGLLFVSIFNPNVNLMTTGCNATVQGATERMLMCLPFGNCANSGYKAVASDGTTDTSYTTRSVGVAGAGIVDNIITQDKPGEKNSLYGPLQLSCTGTECDKNTFNKTNDKITLNTINTTGINRDKLINPRLWLEN